MQEKFSIKQLSASFAAGRRNFDRRFIRATGNTPVEYAQRVKNESAKKAFETSSKIVNEVMYTVGYADGKAFREVFRKFTGLSPLEYRNRYNKEALFLGKKLPLKKAGKISRHLNPGLLGFLVNISQSSPPVFWLVWVEKNEEDNFFACPVLSFQKTFLAQYFRLIYVQTLPEC